MSYILKLGLKGENEAVSFLQKKEYEILERNWRNGHHEIDIIAKKDRSLIFIEVKTRSNYKYGFPEESVDKKKQDFLASAADEYIYQNKHEGEIRFDVISILMKNDNIEIYHIEDAFFPQNED